MTRASRAKLYQSQHDQLKAQHGEAEHLRAVVHVSHASFRRVAQATETASALVHPQIAKRTNIPSVMDANEDVRRLKAPLDDAKGCMFTNYGVNALVNSKDPPNASAS